MEFRKRFDLLRRIVNLTVRLDAKTAELRDAHAALARAEDKAKVWERCAAEREKQRLDAVEERHDVERRLAAELDRKLVPLPPSLPPALTRDRQALSRLEDELAHARELIDKCRREHR